MAKPRAVRALIYSGNVLKGAAVLAALAAGGIAAAAVMFIIDLHNIGERNG